MVHVSRVNDTNTQLHANGRGHRSWAIPGQAASDGVSPGAAGAGAATAAGARRAFGVRLAERLAERL